jgi:hypothetical protein
MGGELRELKELKRQRKAERAMLAGPTGLANPTYTSGSTPASEEEQAMPGAYSPQLLGCCCPAAGFGYNSAHGTARRLCSHGSGCTNHTGTAQLFWSKASCAALATAAA